MTRLFAKNLKFGAGANAVTSTAARLAPLDPSVRSLVNRGLFTLFSQLEKKGGNLLTNEAQQRRSRPLVYELEWRRSLFHQVAEMVLGTPFDPGRVPGLFDLSSVHFSVEDLRWTYGERGLALQGDIAFRPTPGEEVAPAETSGVPAPGEPTTGSFSFRFTRELRTGKLQAIFDHLTLPSHLRGRGVGTTFFREVVRLARDLKISNLSTPDISGDHRYSLAVYGVRFRSRDERVRLVSRFRAFLVDYMSKLPGLEEYDFSQVDNVMTPRELAYAHLDPHTRRLELTPWVPSSLGGTEAELPDYYRVGRLFLMNDAPSYDGTFELKDNSYSMSTLDAYLTLRLGRSFFSPREQN